MTAPKRPSGYSEILNPSDEQIGDLMARKESGELARVIFDRTTRGRVRAAWFRRAAKRAPHEETPDMILRERQPFLVTVFGTYRLGSDGWELDETIDHLPDSPKRLPLEKANNFPIQVPAEDVRQPIIVPSVFGPCPPLAASEGRWEFRDDEASVDKATQDANLSDFDGAGPSGPSLATIFTLAFLAFCWTIIVGAVWKLA